MAEDTMSLAGPRKSDPVADTAAGVRALLGPRRCRGQGPRAEARACPRRPGTAGTRPGLASLPDQDKVSARIAVIASERRVGAYLQARAGTAPDTGKPTLAWRFDQDAIDAEAATDGWYALLTNLDAGEADAAGY